MTDFFSEIVAELAQAQIPCPRLEARELFAFVQHKNTSEIYAGCPVSSAEKEQISALVQKRFIFRWIKLLAEKAFTKMNLFATKMFYRRAPKLKSLLSRR